MCLYKILLSKMLQWTSCGCRFGIYDFYARMFKHETFRFLNYYTLELLGARGKTKFFPKLKKILQTKFSSHKKSILKKVFFLKKIFLFEVTVFLTIFYVKLFIQVV